MPETKEKPFDQAACDRLKAAAIDLGLHTPEVLAVAAMITWRGGLNDASVLSGVWLTGDGTPVTGVDAMIASARQTLKMLHEQVSRAEQAVEQLAVRYRDVAADLVQATSELRAVNEQIQEAERTAVARGGPA